VDSAAHREAALRAARESMVLLKNDANTLPLGDGVRRIAVIGPNANDVEVLLGNYNGTPAAPVTVLQGIEAGAPAGTTVTYAQGSPWADELPVLETIPESALATREDGREVRGLTGEYFNSAAGFDQAPSFTRVDNRVDFAWWGKTPDPRITNDDDFAARWTGELVPPVTGTYTIGASGMNTVRVFVDGKQLVRFNSTHHPTKTVASCALVAGRRYPIRVEFAHTSNDASMQLLWHAPGRDLRGDAIETARGADAVVLVLGLSPRLEGEEMNVPVPGFSGGDRTSIDLPAAQQQLLEAVAALGKKTVLVLLNGSAMAVTWADQHVPAILEAWYPGQAAGTAVADVLFGKYNPAGRLPITFYRSVAQLPPFSDYSMGGRTYRYFAGDALYPFGHGLSYTTFEYRNLEVPATVGRGQPVPIAVDVRNTGTREGDEVVEVYVSGAPRAAGAPIRALKAFRRLALAPGETRRVTLTVPSGELSVVGADGRRTPVAGAFDIAVGGKQPGMKGRADAATTGVVTARVQVK
jgi:beta-glucosidase